MGKENIIKNVKCKIVRQIYASNNFRTFGCILTDNKDEDKIVLNKYGNFTISGDLPYLTEGEEYTLDLKETVHPRFGTQYTVDKVADYEMMNDLEHMPVEQSKEILTKFTTEKQADTLLSVYPNFISMIINGRANEIDLSKLKNIKEYRMNCYIREINTRFKYYYILANNKQYKLSIKDCQELDNLYGTVEHVDENIQRYPYKVFMDNLHRGFLTVDKMLMELRPELKETEDRIEHLALHILNLNEEDNNTYMDANTMAMYCAEIDKDCIKHIKDICINSPLIWYDDKTKRIAKAETYIAESNIANFILDKIKNNKELDLPWERYKKIKDGELTEEQASLLWQFCKHSIVILTGRGGVGKTSCILALLSMLDDANISYTLTSPTGRAAQRLSEQTNRYASTIHKRCLTGEIDSDVIIVDEVSICGLDHFSMILKACTNPKARIILIGDNHQLPSISLGNVLNDLINSKLIPQVELTKVFRYGQGGLSAVASDIYDKKLYTTQLDPDKLVNTLGANKDYTLIKADETPEQIVDIYVEKINKGIKPIDIAVITPWNVKELGTYNLNNMIQSAINPAKANERSVTRQYNKVSITFRKGDIVMNTKNNYSVPTYEGYKEMLDEGNNDTTLITKTIAVFNGDIGKVLEIDQFNNIIIQFNEDMVVFDYALAQNLVLGYCGTIHKYQGSQCPHIILLTETCHEKSYNNNLLYTGVSRASKEVTHIADIGLINRCIPVDGNENRQTQLKDLLLDGYQKISDSYNSVTDSTDVSNTEDEEDYEDEDDNFGFDDDWE